MSRVPKKLTTMPRRVSNVRDQNQIGWTEMGAYLIAGSAAAAFGLSRRTWAGAAIALGGAALIARGMTAPVEMDGSCVVSQTIDRSADEIFQMVRDIPSWPSFIKSLHSAREENSFAAWQSDVDGKRLRGRVEIMDESPGEYIRLRTDDGDLPHEISIELRKAPGDRGIEVSVEIHWAGSGMAFKEMFQSAVGTSAEQLAREGLRCLKQLLEAGEIATTVGQPHGARGLRGKMERAMLRETPLEDQGIHPQTETEGTAPEAAAS